MINLLNHVSGKNILLLQGPMGPFFRRLSHDLIAHGAAVHKINFNGGDFFFYHNRCVNFTESIQEWPTFLADYVNKFQIDEIILFGDCRAHHRDAIDIAKLNKISVNVFEEGYYRPDFITLEKSGVSNHSTLSRNPNHYRNIENLSTYPAHKQVGDYFWHVAFFAFFYYLLSALLWPFFSNYRHHRNLKLTELIYWVLSLYRKIYFRYAERHFIQSIVEPNSGKLFIVPLQVNVDSQVLFHSHYTSIKDFIKQNIISFKGSAPNDTKLIFKHHPLDRGYHNFDTYIKTLIREHSLYDRVFYVFEQKLPVLLRHARGVVIINSTSGLAAIEQGIPTKVCGKAIYALNGLCYQGNINSFWRKAKLFKVDKVLYSNYKEHLMHHTQVNGNFYRRINSSSLQCGLLLNH